VPQLKITVLKKSVMEKTNILITSAGRRVSLVKAFKDSSKVLKTNSKVFITDLNPKTSPASYFADDSFEIGLFTDSDYINNLLEICLKNEISIIIPTLDTELILLAKSKSLFNANGINIIISDLKLIEILRDKITTNTFFNSLKIKTPIIFNKDNMKFPVFLKPLNGSNSKGIYKAENINEIKPSDLVSKNMMILENINNSIYDEYTIDLYYDKNSSLKCVVPRIRLKVVGGESNQGVTKKNEVLDFVKDRFSYIEGAIGCLTLQVFSNKSNPGDIIGIEINPRFGGGYPFSLNAGANFPEFIIREYILNEQIEYFDKWKGNCLNIRYENEIIIND
jgi:carbamoyl-phosphate synthase large subunit